jgi:hypothetical protein
MGRKDFSIFVFGSFFTVFFKRNIREYRGISRNIKEVSENP